MLRSYGGYTWTSEDAPPVNPESRRMLGLTALGIVGAAAGYGATRNLANGYRGVDYIAAAARLGGNLSPFQLGNTFRIPEILSPYLSNQYRSQNIQNFGRWDKDFLKSSSTYDYLLSQTGLTPEELQARGINRGMIGGDDVAHAIEWTPTEGINGKLESVLPDGKRHLLSKDIALLATNQESVSPLNNKRGLNRYAAGVMGAADLNSKSGFDEADVFAKAAIYNDGKEVTPRAVSSFIPVASPVGELKSLGDLSRRTNLARGIASFEIGRFGHLVENVAEQFGGEAGLKIARSVLPKSAPASHMFARYGMLTAAAGGLIIGNEQLDWIRRKGAIGNLGASAVVSAGASYAASRLGSSSKTAFMVGAASFFGQNLLPGFNQGLVPGIATMGVNLDIMRGNALNPFGYQRRIMEGFAPGISDWKTGALLSVGAITMAATKLPGMRERLNVKIARAMNHTDLADIVTQNRNVRDLFYEQVGKSLGVAPENTTGFIERKGLIKDYYNTPDSLDRTRSLNALFSDAEESHLLLGRNNPLNAKLVNELKSIHSSSSGFTREARAMFAHAQASFFGADLTSDKALLKEVDALGFRGAGKLGRLGMVGLAAFVAHGVLTGGLTGSMAGSDELRDIYSGKKMIEMRSSRAWEAGGTPFEGGNTKYYRPHAYALMMNRVREKGIWGENEDQISPIGKWFTKNFTYDLEKQNYWSRPYPISNAAFSDVPIIGGILGATIGKLIKPPKIMHAGDWMREGENGQIEFANVFRGSMIEPAYSLGAVGQGRPQTPFSTDVVNSDLTSQFRQLEGMCFVGSTKILTINGEKPISEVQIGEKVLSLNGEYLKVINKLVIPQHSKQLVKVSFKNTGSSFVATENHWVPVMRNGVISDIQISDLCVKDYLIVPLANDAMPLTIDLASSAIGFATDEYIYWRRSSKEYIEALEYIEKNGDPRSGARKRVHALSHIESNIISNAADVVREGKAVKRWKRHLDLRDPEVLWLLGWFVAGGSTEPDNSRITFTLGWTESIFADQLSKILIDIGCILNTEAGLENSSIQIRCSNNGFLHWLREQFGKNCYEKHIPAWVKQLPRELLVHFMSGLCNGDGWNKGFKSSSEQLVRDVFVCLAKLSVCSNMQMSRSDKNSEEIYSQLFITERHIDNYGKILRRELPEILDEKLHRKGCAYLADGRLYVPVKSIEYLDYIEPVYDLTIEGLHYYVAELVAVHNTGWAKNVVTKTLFGSSTWSTDRPRLANSGEMTSWGNEFWESELGGMGFSNEVLRRIFPNKSGEIQSYNPITNDMPSWLPDRLHYGDIIGSTEQGASRLPGAGFAALHPELKGVDPEAYPLLYKYQILADVAPFTPEFFNAQKQLYTQRQAGQFTEREADWIDRIDSNRARVVNQFNPNYTPEGAIELPGSGLTSSLWRGARSAIRAVAAPAEYMVPMGFRPIQKLMGSDRDPIENYEFNRMYGTPLAFWDKPMRDWFRPAAYSAAHLMGYDGKPAWRAEADTTNEYFDKLEFTKYMQLAEQASVNGMSKEASQYRWQASQTRAGINPDASPLNAYWSMSDAERPYFNSFAQTTNPSERQRILEMVPNDEARLYQTMWSRMDSNDPTLYSNKSVVDNDYLATRYNEVRNELAGYPQPPPNWIGYNEDVDLNDVKVRYIEHTGKDIHDFGMWESDVRKSEGQQFLDGSADYLEGSSSFMFSQMRSEVYNMLGSSQRPPQLNYSVNLGDRPYSHITYNDNRDADIIGALQRYLQ